jgi:hypothetical protein
MFDSYMSKPVQSGLYLFEERPEQGGESAHFVYELSFGYVFRPIRTVYKCPKLFVSPEHRHMQAVERLGDRTNE